MGCLRMRCIKNDMSIEWDDLFLKNETSNEWDDLSIGFSTMIVLRMRSLVNEISNQCDA